MFLSGSTGTRTESKRFFIFNSGPTRVKPEPNPNCVLVQLELNLNPLKSQWLGLVLGVAGCNPIFFPRVEPRQTFNLTQLARVAPLIDKGAQSLTIKKFYNEQTCNLPPPSPSSFLAPPHALQLFLFLLLALLLLLLTMFLLFRAVLSSITFLLFSPNAPPLPPQKEQSLVLFCFHSFSNKKSTHRGSWLRMEDLFGS